MKQGTWVGDPLVWEQLAHVNELLAGVADEGTPRASLHSQLKSVRAKRLRPALLFLTARVGSLAPHPSLIRAAAGLEILHEATLYHDDIVDEAGMRRGEITAQRAHGSVVAALAGSELLYRTGEFFADVPPSLRRPIGHTVEALCRGQLREVETMGDTETSIRVRVRVMRDKTAHLFGLAAYLGAALNDVYPPLLRLLRRFGTSFGMCFQLADDLQDLGATPEELGREPGSDLRDGVYSLPVLFGLASGTPDAERLRCALWDLQVSRGSRPAGPCLALLRLTNGLERSVHLFQSWLAAARADLAVIGVTKPKEVGALTDLLRVLQVNVCTLERSWGSRSASSQDASAPS